MKGLDLSFADPPPQWWRDRRSEGYCIAVQDAWTGVTVPSPCQRNLKNAREAGFLIAAYTCVNNLAGAVSVDKAVAACGSEWKHLAFVAIDVEIAGVPVATMLQHTAQALQRVRELGKPTCIYTAHWYWVGHLGNPVAFPEERLWNAYYDGDPDYDFWRQPYGGWTLASLMGIGGGEQYAGTTQLAGYAVDLNEFSVAFLEDAATEKEEDMTARSPEEMETALNKLHEETTNAFLEIKNLRGDLAALEALVRGLQAGAGLSSFQQVADGLKIVAK